MESLRKGIAMLLALALQAASTLPAPGDGFAEHAFAHFSRAPALAHSSETVDVALAYVPYSTAPAAYTMRLTRRRFQQSDAIFWADSRSCPAMRPVLDAMRAVALPNPRVPGIDSDGDIIMDGAGYRLTTMARFADGQDGELGYSSNVGTPLAAWVDHSLAALARCWSSRPPEG
ncbi:hypothetical protein [Sphingomonas sp. PAMC 26605]|uniref:hypothetical protein n=1 Tax=Sphingomonas sp. PAMC 26605 TaxID=1112214 RepID=UPI00026CA67C|nr:hypothetical protein [Sphingomonas sp. PAMC 26605]